MAKDKEQGGRSGGGDSGGGAYPNPRQGEGRGKKGAVDGFLGHGGQSDMAYRGKGRLGGEKVGGNDNAPAEKSGGAEERDG